jgi:KipI family sensor histidine kinase inhibitor
VSRSIPTGQVHDLGDRALVVGVHDAAAARALVRALTAEDRPEVVEVVGGLATVAVICRSPEDTDRVGPWLELLAAAPGAPASSGETDGDELTVDIACTFEGPDLKEVAERARCSPDEVIALITGRALTVAAVGFSPGFAYLEGLPSPLLDIPRRPRPRPSVPAGSVALANGYAAIYPASSPGGWQLIGHTHETLFDPTTPPYARLSPGDRLQFVHSKSDAVPPPSRVHQAWEPPPGARPVFVVEEPGVRTVLQDDGRVGLASIGVPSAGPADPYSCEVANRLVGNRPAAPVLEITASGPALRCLDPTFVAVFGGVPDIRLNGQAVPHGQVLPVAPGQLLAVGPVRDGFRSFLAVAGGLAGPDVLGSMGSDELSGLGAGPISRGMQLWALPTRPPIGDHVGADAAARLRLTDSGVITLRVVPGPHAEWFAPDALASLAHGRFTVGSASNRVGLRLRGSDGAVPVLRAADASDELDSQATVTGALQVPPDGDPVLLLPDHATLGGYPVLAVVISADHGIMGQCAPGSEIAFAPVDAAEARVALQVQRRLTGSAVTGHYPLSVG